MSPEVNSSGVDYVMGLFSRVYEKVEPVHCYLVFSFCILNIFC